MAKAPTTPRRRAHAKAPPPIDFRALAEQYGSPVAAIAAAGWFAYCEVFLPIREHVEDSIAEMAESGQETQETLKQYGMMLNHLYRQSGGPPLPAPRQWSPVDGEQNQWSPPEDEQHQWSPPADEQSQWSQPEYDPRQWSQPENEYGAPPEEPVAEEDLDTKETLRRYGMMLDHLYRQSGGPPLPSQR